MSFKSSFTELRHRLKPYPGHFRLLVTSLLRNLACLLALRLRVADRPETDRDRTAGTHGRHRGLYAICHLGPTTASPILDRLGRPIALSRSSPGKL